MMFLNSLASLVEFSHLKSSATDQSILGSPWILHSIHSSLFHIRAVVQYNIPRNMAVQECLNA
jgi:hypothetical protein